MKNKQTRFPPKSKNETSSRAGMTNLFKNFNDLTSAELIKLDKKFGWSLNAKELETIQNYFKKQNRPPTRGELETIAQTWSEHCKHKTFSGPVDFTFNGRKQKIENLFRETIVKATRKLNKKWCLSVFKDNAGVIELDKKWAIAFKVETHNHPCAIEPYGGAETGVGGVIRDILGVGLGAKPVLNSDNFCFAPLNYKGKLPAHALSPEQIFRGVVKGVRDYGNRMGIPTVSGSIYFDEDYRLNPLVYVGTVGVMPKWAINKKVKPGDLIVTAGGRTGRDGIHGATFSSAGLDEETSTSAVQIGNALNEKKVLDALLVARDKKLYRAVTDCGAGGFSSAIGELGADCGSQVYLENAPLKVTGLLPWEIWVSESQERMVFSVPPKNFKKLKKIFDYFNCPATILGKFTNSGRLEVFYKEKSIVDIDMDFLHKGVPLISKKAVYNEVKKPVRKIKTKPKDLGGLFKKVLTHQNVASRSWVIRQYDHEVQAGTLVKPLQCNAPQDATVILPHTATGNLKSKKGFAVSQAINPAVGKLDPYRMALVCVDEAIRNLACVGADISRCALLDNFCWASPDNPKVLGALVQTAKGCYDASIGYGAPFISGKDSFYNQSKDTGGKDLLIPHTLLISAVAPVDITKTVTSFFKGINNPLYIIGSTQDDIDASVFGQLTKIKNNEVPKVDISQNLKAYKALHKAIEADCVLSSHDLSDGGFAVTLAEMSFGCNIGALVDLQKFPFKGKTHTDEIILFSETPGRILVEIDTTREKDFLKIFKGIKTACVGHTIPEKRLFVQGLGGNLALNENISKLQKMWDGALEKVLAGRK